MMSALPFSRPTAVASIRAAGQQLVLTADAAERQALAALLDLVSLDSFEAKLTLRRDGARVLVTGRFEADVVQACVVTLEPIAARIVEDVALTFAEEVVIPDNPRADKMPDLAEIEVQLSEDDPPEPISGGRFDPGPVLVELLSLALDPYPRKAGVEFAMPDGQGDVSPFAALARLKKPE
jgi:uncharacterized metal-binding protein YceD (DUF177 family)